MYGIYANIGGILMVNVTIYSIHGSYGRGYNIFYRLYKSSKINENSVAQKTPEIPPSGLLGDGIPVVTMG